MSSPATILASVARRIIATDPRASADVEILPDRLIVRLRGPDDSHETGDTGTFWDCFDVDAASEIDPDWHVDNSNHGRHDDPDGILSVRFDLVLPRRDDDEIDMCERCDVPADLCDCETGH